MDDPRRLHRRWFLASLAVFFLWVATLGTMAAFSGHRPTPRSETPERP